MSFETATRIDYLFSSPPPCRIKLNSGNLAQNIHRNRLAAAPKKSIAHSHRPA
jgi:hypothetical protein